MSDKPIIFSADMVRALLEGRKTQTRRVLPAPKSLQPNDVPTSEVIDYYGDGRLGAVIARDGVRTTSVIPLPFTPGDRLWVREKGWEMPERTPQMIRDGADTWESFYYDADDIACFEHEQFAEWGFKRRPSIHMPRWASRLTLIVTDVRVERVQDISEEDAKAEGVKCVTDGLYHYFRWQEDEPEGGIGYSTAKAAFRELWNSLHKPGFQWDDNPWCAAVSFETHHANIDELREAA